MKLNLNKKKGVMRGLDPRIHLKVISSEKMDGRVKPGHDGSL
jgi:hypothetical protein